MRKPCFKNNYSLLVILVCVIVTYLPIFPNIFYADNYQPNHDQWGAEIALWVNVATTILPQSVVEARGHLMLLGIVWIVVMIYSIYCLLRLTELYAEKKAFVLTSVTVGIFFLLFSHCLYIRRNDIAITAFTLFACSIVLRHYYTEKTYNSWQMLAAVLTVAIAVGFRKNTILLAPALLYPIFSHYERTRYRSWAIKVSLTMTISAAIFFIDPLLARLQGLEKDHGERVFMSSDIICMRQLRGESLGRFSIMDNTFFMQKYGTEINDDEVNKEWITEIKKHPVDFLKARTICYAQFLSIGILPDWLHNRLCKSYPDLIFPKANDFIANCGVYNELKISEEDIKDQSMLQAISEVNPLYIKKRIQATHGLFKKNWTLESRILLAIYALCFISFIVNMTSKRNHWIAIWFGLLCMLYLASFLPFTPTPDFRYHILPSFLALYSLALNKHCKRSQRRKGFRCGIQPMTINPDLFPA